MLDRVDERDDDRESVSEEEDADVGEIGDAIVGGLEVDLGDMKSLNLVLLSPMAQGFWDVWMIDGLIRDSLGLWLDAWVLICAVPNFSASRGDGFGVDDTLVTF